MIPFRQDGTSDSAERAACRRHELPPNREHSETTAEIDELACELAGAFGDLLNSYREQAKLTTEEAAKRASLSVPDDIDRILNCSPDGVSWLDLYSLAEKDADLALKRWAQIKEAARNEIRTGYRAARVVEGADGPWERARFSAVRTKLMEDWQPRNTTEQLLMDQLSQLQLLLWRWQEALSTWTDCARIAPRQAKKGQSYETMRVWESEALEGAGRKVELLHRLYLRTLKALQELRRPRLPVSVRHAEMVSVGPIQVCIDNC